MYINTAYRPLSNTILNKNSVFIKLGNNTFPNAITKPTIIVPKNNNLTPDNVRMTSLTVSKTAHKTK